MQDDLSFKGCDLCVKGISSEECYRRLGLKASASWPEVKSAFRRMARRYHPDACKGIDPAKFEMISEAYMTLRDSMKDGDATKGSSSVKERAKRDLSWIKKPYTTAKAWIFDVAEGVSKKRKMNREENKRRCDERERRRISAIEEIIADTEVYIDGVVSKVGRPGGPSERERFFKRLESRLPEVRNMAISRLVTCLTSSEVTSALENSFYIYGIDETGLDILFSVPRDGMTDLRFARSMAPHFMQMSQGGARKYIRWISQLSGASAIYGQLGDHPSPEVRGFLFSRWPTTLALPIVDRIASLLCEDKEIITVPLLRLISRRHCSGSLLLLISDIYQKTESPSIKAWAGAIVCKSTVV